MRLRQLLAVSSLVISAASLPAQSPDAQAPPGFTLYRFVGEGVNAPPIALRIRGELVEGPSSPEAFISVREGRVAGGRVRIGFDVFSGTARFLGRREGDVLRGFIFFDEGSQRGAAPVTLAPLDVDPGSGVLELDALASAPGISRIAVVPEGATVRAGERRRFVARVFDEAGGERTDAPVEWYASLGNISAEGEFVSSDAGSALVFAVSGDAVGATTATVEAPRVASLSIFTDVPARLAVGSRLELDYDALTSASTWDLDPDVEVVSSATDVIGVQGNALLARKPGRATVTVSAGDARESFDVQAVAAGSGPFSITGVPEGPVRTGDVLTLGTTVADAVPVWSVSEPGADVHPGGDFVAERPGSYTVVAVLGERVATAAVHVEPRGLAGRIRIVGHGRNVGTFTSDIWPLNGHVYLGTHQADQVRTYDVSDPANPVLTDSVIVDARVVNNLKVSPDGRLLVATREGATSRRNGVVIFSIEDPAHPRVTGEYTETLSGGVHNVFWVGDLLYATSDATGDMHILDLSDPVKPREVGRWGIPVEGKFLHDVWVQEGIAYLSYMMEGVVILDVGGAGKGGTPAKPVLVSRLFYPDGPTHSALRWKDYLFLGDEDFSVQGTVPSIPGIDSDPRGEVHVLDVSDLEHPRYVARYELPEAGAHNLWIQDEVLYVGYYQGGIRAIDISGRLRGDLYRQGRDIAYYRPSAGPADAKVPFAPMVWGVFPMFRGWMEPEGDVLYAADYNSGLWAFRLERGETTAD